MESQSSQPSLSTMRQAIPARSSTTISAAATNPASSYSLPVELMMYPTQRPLMAPSLQLHNCLLANQLCTCAFGAHSCSIHHAPIAYGQASSSFVAPTTAPAPIPSAEHPLVLPPTGPQDSRQNETARRETRLPPTLIQPVRSSLRLKRGAPAPLPAQVQSALDEVRAPKLRRIPGDAGREIQTVASETMQQPSAVIAVAPVVPDVVLPPPSTSQLVTGPVPSSHGSCTRCHGISPSQCTAYPSSTCQCSNFCPGLAGAQATIVQPAASRSNYPPLPSQVNHPLSNQVISQFYTSAATAAARTPAAQAQAMAQDMQMLNAQIRLRQQQLQQQQQLMNQAMTPNPYRLTYFSNGQLYVPVRSLGIETLLVNVAHPDYLLGERPLDRHHMFAAPVTEPQPIGCTLQDIEKHSEKMQYIKDGELPDTEQERCIVCQCELETGEEIRNLSCSHQFHVDCIDRWLSYNKKCPVCRLDIDQPKDTVKGALWIE